MNVSSPDDRRRVQRLDRPALELLQVVKLNRLLEAVRGENAFYQRKLADCPSRLESLAQLSELPMTSKDELQPVSPDEPFATNHTYPPERYVRCHQTSGT